MAQTLLVVLAVLLVVGSSTANDTTTMDQIAEKCREGTSLTKEMIETLVKNQVKAAAVDEPTRCYFKCLLQSAGLMHADGKIELDVDHEKFSECLPTTPETNICEKAFTFHRCIHSRIPNLPVF